MHRIGIVGAGFGATGHLPALLNHPQFEVVAIASPSSAARIAKESNVPHSFTSCAEMLAGCELDAVTIASPPFNHLGDVLAALEARKHVMCEKPFALNVADANTMVDAEGHAGTTCGVAHEFRFVPQAIALKELIDNGHLGPLRNMELTMLRANLRRDESRPRSWWFEAGRGGGLTGAMVSHLIDEANWLAGRGPTQAVGFERTANKLRSDDKGAFESGVADGAFALLNYGQGFAGRLCADSTTAVESFTCAVHGERRTAVASGPNIIEVTLYAIDADETDELTCTPSRYAAYSRINANVPPLMDLYDQFAAKIEGESNALPTFTEALTTQRALAAIGYEHPG